MIIALKTWLSIIPQTAISTPNPMIIHLRFHIPSLSAPRHIDHSHVFDPTPATTTNSPSLSHSELALLTGSPFACVACGPGVTYAARLLNDCLFLDLMNVAGRAHSLAWSW